MIDWIIEDRLAILTLDRPAVRNAMPVTAWRRLGACIEDIAGSGAEALIVRSAVPGVFSAGADLNEFASFREDPGATASFRMAMRHAIDALARLPIPTIAAIDGGCYGAAVALALACDIRVAGQGARFAVTPARLGLGYPAADVERLAAQVGRGQAGRLLFSAEAIDAAEAGRIGLVEIVTDDAAVEASRLSAAILDNVPAAVRMLKRTIADPADPAHDAAFDATFATPAFAEALAAFRSRRTP
ncbi:MAG: enoyl-CoA hydratase/isomerase family protein [Sphingomonas sp.]